MICKSIAGWDGFNGLISKMGGKRWVAVKMNKDLRRQIVRDIFEPDSNRM